MYNSRNFYEFQASMVMEKIIEQEVVLRNTTDILIKIDIMARLKSLESEREFYMNQLRNM